jgi:uncharacterized protein YcfL
MMRKALLLLVILAVGCASAPTEQAEELPVAFLSEDTEKAVEIVSHRAERLPSGHVAVVLVLVSKKKKKPIWIDWKTVFFDRRGIRVEETVWHTQQVMPVDNVMLRANSMRKDIES